MASPKTTPAEQALNTALAAGFVITRHARQPERGAYWHQMIHSDGRALSIYTELNGARFLSAQGYNRNRWNTARLAARSIPALQRLVTA